MMLYWIVGVAAFLVGYAASLVVMARDRRIVKLLDDDLVVKRPADGLTLVAVTPDILRRFVAMQDKGEGDAEKMTEARDLYRKT